MKRKPLLFLLLMAMFAPLAMQAQGLVKHPRHTLQAEPAQSISIQNVMPDREDGWLYYDDGTYATSVGAGGNLYWGSMFPPALLTQYDGTMLTKVAIHTSYEGSATLNVYVGGSQPSGSPSATQTFTMVGDGDFMEISLDNPVEIDATQNLWITFYQSGVTYPADACQDTENANNRWVSIDGNSWLDLAAAGLPGYGWMIRGYVETINTDCPKPLGFAASNVMPHSATLSWRTSEEVTSWEIVYSNRAGFNPDQATPILVSENPYTLTGLEEGTTFYAYVRSACGSDWSSLLSFTTPTECDAPIDLEATEVTATTATLDWTGYQNSYNVRYWIPAQINFNETDFTQVGEDYVAESVLTTYTIDLSAFSGVGNVAIRHYNITDMFRLNVDDIVLTNSQGQVVASEDFETGEFNLNWVNYDNDGDGYVWDIWEITQQDNNGEDVGNGSYCATSASYNNTGALTPDNWLIIPNVELGGTLTFVARGQDPSWSDEVFGVFVSTTQLVIPASEPVVVENISNPYTLTGLTPETEYVVQVQGINADCGNLEWSVNLTFTTLPTCQVPANFTVDYIGNLTAKLSWESDASSFDVMVNDSIIENIGEPRYTLDNLELATIYSVKVRANCGDEGYSDWSASVSFHTELCNTEDQCEITLEFADSYGDGWNGASLAMVDVATGIVIANLTMADGSAASGTVAVCDGRDIQFVWLSGNYDDECSYTITSALGEVIIEGEGGFDYFNYTVQCSLDACDTPVGLGAEPTANSALLSWNGAAETYNIRYRKADINWDRFEQVDEDVTVTEEYVPYTFDLSAYAGQSGHIAIRHYNVTDMYWLLVDDVTYNDNVLADFERGLPEGWLCIDKDGDGFNWMVYDLTFGSEDENYAHSGIYGLVSQSYDNSYQEALTPDNWFISPYMELGGTLTIYARGLDPDYVEEVFGIFVTTEEVDSPWIMVEDVVDGLSYNLTGLDPLTTYEFQVQIADEECVDPAWSDSYVFTTLTGNNFVVDGDWDVASNWFSGVLPEEGADVMISANAIIPAGYTANVGNITVGEEGSITIEDGGQLIHTNEGVVATLEKNIDGYGITGENNLYYLLSTPVNDEFYYEYDYNLIFPEDVDTLLNENGYDLYGFDFEEELQWINQKASEYFYMWKGNGYLYANNDDVTLEFTGVLNPVPEEGYVNFIQGAYLNYVDTTCMFANWNLVGNPYPCDAYIFTCDYDQGSLYIVSEDFYRMNETGDEIIVSSGVVAPMEGVFVVAEASSNVAVGQSTLDSKGSYLSLNLSKDDHLIDAARIRFGEGKAIEKLQFDPNHTKVYFTVDDKDYAVLYTKNQATMPVNFRAEKSGKYALNFTAESVSFSYLHLIDKLTGTEVDLLANPEYTFNAKAGETASRFIIVYEVK